MDGSGGAATSAIFQYPLMDRLGFWGVFEDAVRLAQAADFSIR